MKRRTEKIRKGLFTAILTAAMVVTLPAAMPVKDMSRVQAATLNNPRIGSDDVVTWDCVWFGRYPQSDAKGQKKDPVKWRVLFVEGNDAFLIADQNLDVQNYNETKVSVTWEKSTIRSWLNGYGGSSNVCNKDYTGNNFINRAFTETEKNAILTANLVNANNQKYGTKGGNNTQDKVFLLSFDEITNVSYGLCLPQKDNDKYPGYDSRKRTNTAYVEAGGTMKSEFVNDKEEVYHWSWWLRSPGMYATRAMDISELGFISEAGGPVNQNGGTVRRLVCPALHLDLTATDVWSYAGTVDSTGKTTDGVSAPSVETGTEDKKADGLQLTGISKIIAAGKKIQLIPEFIPEDVKNQELIWESSNPAYADVSPKGVVTTKKAGAGKSVTITAKTQDGSNLTAVYEINIVKHAVKSIKLKAKNTSVKVGKSVTVKATVKTTGKTANKTLRWSSSNEKYATVSKKGVVKTKKAGKGKTVKITAMATDGTGKKAVIKIKIK